MRADLFRRHVFDSYGAHFAFWVNEDGTHSNSIDLSVLEPLKKRAQDTVCPRDEQMMVKGFENDDDMTQYHQRNAQVWQDYARKLSGMLIMEALKSQSSPRIAIDVSYEPFSLEARARLLRSGEHKIEEFLAQPNIAMSHALTLNRLNTLRPIYAVIKHDEKPGTSPVSLYQERKKGCDPVDAAFYSSASLLASMLGSEDRTASRIADRYYTRATVLLHNEEGLLEQEEAKKRLSAFSWKIPKK